VKSQCLGGNGSRSGEETYVVGMWMALFVGFGLVVVGRMGSKRRGRKKRDVVPALRVFFHTKPGGVAAAEMSPVIGQRLHLG
jgi:hypothetical protein